MTMEVSLSQGVSVTVDVVPEASVREYISSKVGADGREDQDDPFYVCDLGLLIDLYDRWTSAMCGIQPFYAVKCNNDSALLKTLSLLGAGFDCASKNEIKSVLDLVVPADRIIYANPCKQVSHLQFAASKGVSLMTFDNESELHKVKTHFSAARLLLRIRADDPTALFPLGEKFGCSVSTGKDLLNTASQLGLSVVGVCFHVGNCSQSPAEFIVAVEIAAELVRHAEGIGYHMTLLDIGGGFPGDQQSGDLFAEMATAMTQAIAANFSGFQNLKVIAEPGRYFACSTHTVAVSVISKCVSMDTTSNPGKSAVTHNYYLSEGAHGTLRYFLENERVPELLKPPLPSEQPRPSRLWGPTMDAADKICDLALLPELDIGDWLFAQDMGAYTVCVGSSFNGFCRPRTHYYVTGVNSSKLRDLVKSN